MLKNMPSKTNIHFIMGDKGVSMGIERVGFIQLYGNTVKMQIKHKDGKFRNHYHRYGTREKAIAQYLWWKSDFECAYDDIKEMEI